jgi:hypothetical protein
VRRIPDDQIPKLFCEQCGEPIDRRYFVKRGPREGHSRGLRNSRGIRFCSGTCRNLARTKEKVGYIDKHGYRRISQGKRGTDREEHLIVMEKMLGRKLLPGETVHHKNGIRHDNAPTNLELWRHKHGKGGRVSDLVAWAHEIVNQYGEAPFTQEHIEQGRKDVQALFGC